MSDDQVKERVQKLTLIDQNLQNSLHQKQQFQSQIFEVDNALSEIEKTKMAYKIVGNIMVLSEKDALKAELMEKKEMLALRVKSIEKQENQLKEKAKVLREEVNDK